MPNHKTDSVIGSSCVMNSLGRHYRDQTDTGNPTCDYESSGVKCDFFTTVNEYNQLTYPSDITLGPAVADPPAINAELAAILSMLEAQKVEAEKRSQRQDEQMSSLQTQVNQLSLGSGPATASSAHSLPPLPSAPPASAFSQPTSPPQVVASAAARMTAQLQSGLGHSHNMGYENLTMEQLRSNAAIVSEANRILANHTSTVPPLNPLSGMGQALGTLSGGNNSVSSVDALYQATTVNKQLREFEFSATGNFAYKSQIRQDNCNATCFAFGAFKHLEAIKTGLIPNVSDKEFIARLRHLKNVYEVACLSSNLTCFTDASWQVAREYDSRVIAEIESGSKTWDTLANGLETDSIYCAKETVQLKNQAKKVKEPKDPKDPKKLKDAKDPKKNGCTTYNTHRSTEGCFWEMNNKGESCVFEHFCSWCKANRNVSEKHKSIHCEHKAE